PILIRRHSPSGLVQEGPLRTLRFSVSDKARHLHFKFDFYEKVAPLYFTSPQIYHRLAMESDAHRNGSCRVSAYKKPISQLRLILSFVLTSSSSHVDGSCGPKKWIYAFLLTLNGIQLDPISMTPHEVRPAMSRPSQATESPSSGSADAPDHHRHQKIH
ncbi:hypothetical protein WG66_013413, partial [Moniliophthora roreri]